MRRVAEGIYADRYGYRVCWRDRGHQREKRFPADAPLEVLTEWRRHRIAQAPRGSAPKTSFARDVARYLAPRKGLRSFVTERAQLRAWLQLYPRLSRWALTSEHVRLALTTWQTRGYSAQEIRHRVRALRRLYRALDGPTEITPCDGVPLPRLPKPRPIPVPDDLVRAVAVQLRASEIAGRLRSAKTRARYLVLATTGQRPAQVMRARPTDVDLTQRLWWVRPAKGDAGTVVALNDDMHAAWTLFASAHAWGAFNARSFARTLRRNGWPRGIRPYNLRHAVGMALSVRGVDLGDVQAHMGHADPRTTRSFYVPALVARQQAASATIEGRVGPAAISPGLPAVPASGVRKEKAK